MRKGIRGRNEEEASSKYVQEIEQKYEEVYDIKSLNMIRN